MIHPDKSARIVLRNGDYCIKIILAKDVYIYSESYGDYGKCLEAAKLLSDYGVVNWVRDESGSDPFEVDVEPS